MAELIQVVITPELRNTYGECGRSVTWAWCVDNFGPPLPNRDATWYWNTLHTFFFKNEQDALLFTLRWSEGIACQNS